MRYIFNDISSEDLALATRALRWLLANPEKKDAIVSVPDIGGELNFYVKRCKASISVRRC